MQRTFIRLAAVVAAALTVVWVVQTADADPVAAVNVPAADQELSCSVQGSAADAAARPSPLTRLRFSYNGGEGLLCYGAPSARGREVMGGLVPFGSPWRLGANEPTALHLSAPTRIGGVSVDAGTYSLYAIPGAEEWEFFLNPNYERWGIPINADVRSTEIGSFTAAVSSTSGMVEKLTFANADGGLVMEWENTRIMIPIG